MSIKNIVFDIGMVLVDFHWARTMRELGFSEEAVAHLGANMILHPLWNEMDKNIIPEHELKAKFQEMSPQYADEIDIFFDNVGHVITDFPQSAKWLRSLKERGYRVYLLSNYPKRMFLMHEKIYSFMPYTDGRVVSYECHLTKPDPAIYRLLCDKYGLLPQECVFLDDKKENVDAARNLGFCGIHVTTQPQAIADLDKLLDEKGDKT